MKRVLGRRTRGTRQLVNRGVLVFVGHIRKLVRAYDCRSSCVRFVAMWFLTFHSSDASELSRTSAARGSGCPIPSRIPRACTTKSTTKEHRGTITDMYIRLLTFPAADTFLHRVVVISTVHRPSSRFALNTSALRICSESAKRCNLLPPPSCHSIGTSAKGIHSSFARRSATSEIHIARCWCGNNYCAARRENSLDPHYSLECATKGR